MRTDDRSVREALKDAVENNVPGAEEGLEWHERNLLAQNRQRAAKKKARKVARASRKKNR